jgi:hypothetical protein
MALSTDENNLVNKFLTPGLEVHSYPGEGRFTAWWIKAKHLFDKDDSSLIQELFERITSKEGPKLSASTLRWFSKQQLSTLGTKIAAATTEKIEKAAMKFFFQEAVAVAHQRKHSGLKQLTLAKICESCEEKKEIEPPPVATIPSKTVPAPAIVLPSTYSNEDFSSCVKSGDFSLLDKVTQEGLARGDTRLLLDCLKFYCLANGLVQAPENLLDYLEKHLTVKQIDTYVNYISAGKPLEYPDLAYEQILIEQVFNNKPPENFSNLSLEAKKKSGAIQNGKSLCPDCPDELLEKKYNFFLSSNYFSRREAGTLGDKLTSMKKTKETAAKKEALQREQEVLQRAQQQKDFEERAVREKELKGLMHLLSHPEPEAAKAVVEAFTIESELPKELWAFGNNYPSTEIPFQELQGTYNKDDDVYLVTMNGFLNFSNSLEDSIKHMGQLEKDSRIQANTRMLTAVQQITATLHAIDKQKNELVSANIIQGQNFSLSPDQFKSLKFPNALRNPLIMNLRKAEEERILHFMGSLAVLTLNRAKDEDNLVQTGLAKFRDYICWRNPRLLDMEEGKMGVAGFFFETCCGLLFHEQYPEGSEKYFRKLHDGPLIPIAEHRRSGGDYSGHFTCLIQCEEGIYEFASIGSRKTFQDSQKIDRGVSVGEELYKKCKPLSRDKISVPAQNANNCYLCAGWLQFCSFLHFYSQSFEGV